jgi:hypothetical protein
VLVRRLVKITGSLGLWLLIASDRFASVEAIISNVVELLFAGAFNVALGESIDDVFVPLPP